MKHIISSERDLETTRVQNVEPGTCVQYEGEYYLVVSTSLPRVFTNESQETGRVAFDLKTGRGWLGSKAYVEVVKSAIFQTPKT